MPNDRRVVVTGLGVVSSIGIGWEEFWKNLLAGKSGISRISSFDSSPYDRHFAGEIKNFKATDFISDKRVLQMGRASQLAVAACKLAMADTGFRIRKSRNTRVGICIGTTMGEIQVLERLDDLIYSKKKFEVDQNSAVTYAPATISSNVAKFLKLNGPNIMFSNACAAGNYAVGLAYDYIRSGRIDFMLAGGADAFSRIAFTGFSRLYAIAPEKCQPFDLNRQGMIPGEGGAVLFLEALESAIKRNARIYAEIKGYGLSCDARHMTNPDPIGIQKAIKKSLKLSQLSSEEINYVSAHGTGTRENDRAECIAFKAVFIKGRIPTSSIKSMLGHTMGAASAFESIACCLAIQYGVLPPTINVVTQDNECEINCIPNIPINAIVKNCLNNSQAFGGNNAAVVFKKFPE